MGLLLMRSIRYIAKNVVMHLKNKRLIDTKQGKTALVVAKKTVCEKSMLDAKNK